MFCRNGRERFTNAMWKSEIEQQIPKQFFSCRFAGSAYKRLRIPRTFKTFWNFIAA